MRDDHPMDDHLMGERRTPATPGTADERRREALGLGLGLGLPTVQGQAVGRSLLHPSSGSVEAAVDTAVGLL
ncbi:hypothetical protein [Streptomyces sp. AK08-02]|uniref:hypothetical protein n=1 Tax=Streptomyces sp. AK08-02 TaxID=3028654 RepID=UPI0039F64802